MNRITTLTLALLAAAGLTLAGCNKRDDMPPTGAGPGTTTTTPGSTTTPDTSSTSPAMPPASAASQ